MKLEDKKRILIQPDGGVISLHTSAGTALSHKYDRVVFGARGAYVEISESDLRLNNTHIPKDQLYRLSDLRIYYIEFRSNDVANVKVYYQLKTVAYADYKLGKFYISPNDLFLSDGRRVLPVELETNQRSEEFFE